MSISLFIKRHPVLTYFVVTFAISWSGVFIVAGSTGIPATNDQFEKFLPIAMLPFLLGPGIASIFLTGILYGKAGFRELLSRLFRWRVNYRWYAVALLTLPIFTIVILFVLSQFSEVFLPDILTTDDKVSLILTGIVYGIIGGGLLEELGWTGFAVPKLKSSYGIFTTGFIVGGLWGAWHFLPVIWGCGNSSGELDLPKFLPGFFFHYAGLIPFRILMVWIYDRTNSLLVPMLMHATLTAGTFFIFNISETGMPLFIYYLLLAVALWIFVAAVAAANGWQLSRQTRG